MTRNSSRHGTTLSAFAIFVWLMMMMMMMVVVMKNIDSVTGLLIPDNSAANPNRKFAAAAAGTTSPAAPIFFKTPDTYYTSSSIIYSDDIETEVVSSSDAAPILGLQEFLERQDTGGGRGHNMDERKATSYHTLTPTYELLVDWTLTYVDAVDLAGGCTRVSIGVQEMLSDDFVFCSPTIGPLSKSDFTGLMQHYRLNGLDLASVVPDLTVRFDGWHQDPHNPWRIWTVARYTGTHTGTARLPGTGLQLKPSSQPQRFTTGPELQSFLWTPAKKLLWQTVGYVGDTYTGSNQGHGSGNLDGLLVSMGLPPLFLDTTEPLRKVESFLSQFRQAETPKLRSPYSHLPQWWHERTKTSDRNIHR